MKLIEACKNFMVDGSFFKYMPLYGNSTAKQMAIAYILKRSGRKLCSDLIVTYTDDKGLLTNDGEKTIGDILTLVYKDNWDRKWNAIMKEYDPLENYDRNEETKVKVDNTTDIIRTKGEQIDKDNLGSHNDTTSYGDYTDRTNYGEYTEKNDHGSQHETNKKGERSQTETEGIAGFNSSNYNNADQNKTEIAGVTDEVTRDQYTDSNIITSHEDSLSHGSHDDTVKYGERIDTHTEGKREDKGQDVLNGTTVTTGRVHGNIGVTTSQQMLKSELDLRVYNFFENMFKDIDQYLCLKIWSDDEYEDRTINIYNLYEKNQTISVDPIDNGIKVNITNSDGEISSAEIHNGTQGAPGEPGKDGLPGKDGAPGKDGKTPKFKIQDTDLFVSYDEEV